MTKHPLSRFTPIADAVARLFHPSAEVVIHELSSDKVYYIANPFSGRRPGDISLLKLKAEELENEGDIIGPYEKAGEKGQLIRAVTSVLRDDNGKALGLMCINLDYSGFEPALDLLESLIRPRQTRSHPEILFRNDWRDQIKLEIRTFLEAQSLSLDNLNAGNRRSLMACLDEKGLFYAKKSIEQVAAILNVSRATAYNDLQTVRKTASTRKKG
ncbi:MAG: PAS domain-containing protein [Desulfobacterales bacterium]|nr:PAS domain-containing protein [Desulfobacterales bacterium]